MITPYAGLTVRLGKREVNVHDVHEGTVYFGEYHDEADDRPCRCVGLYRMSAIEFRDSVEKAVAKGAVTFTLTEGACDER